MTPLATVSNEDWESDRDVQGGSHGSLLVASSPSPAGGAAVEERRTRAEQSTQVNLTLTYKAY